MLDAPALALRVALDAVTAYDRFGFGLPAGELLVYADGEWAWSGSRFAVGRENDRTRSYVPFSEVSTPPAIIMRADPHKAGPSLGHLADALVASYEADVGALSPQRMEPSVT